MGRMEVWRRGGNGGLEGCRDGGMAACRDGGIEVWRDGSGFGDTQTQGAGGVGRELRAGTPSGLCPHPLPVPCAIAQVHPSECCVSAGRESTLQCPLLLLSKKGWLLQSAMGFAGSRRSSAPHVPLGD